MAFWVLQVTTEFVQNYGVLARPLTNLLKKKKFNWSNEAEAAFLNLKKTMTSTLRLTMPNFDETVTIETDASGDGIGVVLIQQGKRIAFISRVSGVIKQS